MPTVTNIVKQSETQYGFRYGPHDFLWDQSEDRVYNVTNGFDPKEYMEGALFTLPDEVDWREVLRTRGGVTNMVMNGGVDETEIINWYGGSASVPDPIPGVELTGAGAPVVSLAALLLVRPALPFLRQLITWILTRGIVRGTTVRWANLPPFLKLAIGAAGGQYVGDLLIDTDPEGDIDAGIIPFDFGDFNFGGSSGRPGLNDGDKIVSVSKRTGESHTAPYVVGTEIQLGKETYHIASGWYANTVWFYRFRNGKTGVQNDKGVWKIIKYRKGTVLFSSGATDLKTMNKAANILEKQASRTAKTMRFLGYQVRRKQNPD